MKIMLENLDWLSQRGKPTDPINKLFGDRIHKARNIIYLKMILN